MFHQDLIEKIHALQRARAPTSVLIHAVADAAARCLAAATGARVDIVLQGIATVSRAPEGAQAKQKKG